MKTFVSCFFFAGALGRRLSVCKTVCYIVLQKRYFLVHISKLQWRSEGLPVVLWQWH